MSVILVIAAFQTFLLAILLYWKKGKDKSDSILSTYFLFSAITIFLSYLEIVNRASGYPYLWLMHTSTPPIMLLGPLIWLYVKSLTTQKFKIKSSYLLLLIPFLIVLILFVQKFYIVSDEVKVNIDSTESFRNDFIFPLVMILIAISNIGFTLWGIILIERYRKKLRSYFSQTERIDLAWLKFFLVSTLISYIAISALYMLDAVFGLMDYNSLQIIGYAIVSVFLLVLGFFGLKQGNVFTSSNVIVDFDKTADIAQMKSPVTPNEELVISRLLDKMKIDKPYLDQDITLAKLSELLKVTPENLSGILNGRLNLNFFDFINHYRIEEFKFLCKDPKNRNITIIAMAYDCGFNSKATFNRVFKKSVGCTPGEYLSKCKG